MTARGVRLLSSKGLMPPNEATPVFEELLTLPVNKFSLGKLVSQVEDSNEKYNKNKNEFRDYLAIVLLFAQQFAGNLPEKSLECKKLVDEFEKDLADIALVISNLEKFKENMWSLFQPVPPSSFDFGISKFPVLKQRFNQIGCTTNFEEILENTKKLANSHNKVIETKGLLTEECFNPPVFFSMSEGNYKVKSGKLVDFIELSIFFERETEILADKIHCLKSKKSTMDQMIKQFNNKRMECTDKIITKLKTQFRDELIYYLGSEAVKLVNKVQT